jgi:small subunit ribosomal protein S1
MTTNPNPGSDDVREENTPPVPAENENQTPEPARETSRRRFDDDDDDDDSRGAAAEVLPTPAAPKISSEYDPDSIVNLDFIEEEDDEDMDLGHDAMLALINQYEETLTDIQEGQILQGTVIEVRENEVLLNIGFKSEGVINLDEFGASEVTEGDTFDVFLEKLENQDGLVVLSKERADFLKVWDKIKVAHENGDIVTGIVDRRIKGGLVVKLWGVDTFLPGSQVALRQVPNLEDMIGEEIQCRIIKKNKRRRNVVVSRRIVLEQERESKKRSLISELEKGQVRMGVVKNITDFGAFVDLGGIDGLLHITDLSWGRVNHPSEVVAIGQEIEVKVLDFEEERERISLGLKQLQNYPWDDVEEKYPEESIVRGRVVSITNYGAFVELEKGIEGLIHISEMSWTRHIKHPSKVVSIGDEVDVMVLKIDKQNEKISLGLKQCESDPWLTLIERYPPAASSRARCAT